MLCRICPIPFANKTPGTKRMKKSKGVSPKNDFPLHALIQPIVETTNNSIKAIVNWPVLIDIGRIDSCSFINFPIVSISSIS